jgi:signal transduction histidine kinase
VIGAMPGFEPELGPGPFQQVARELAALQRLHAGVPGTGDVAEVQQCIGAALTEGLGFPVATVGLVDEAQLRVGSWRRFRAGDGDQPALPALPIRDHGLLASAFERPGRVVRGNLGAGPVAVAALVYRDQPLGLLAVEAPEGGPGASLEGALDRFSPNASEDLSVDRMSVDRSSRLAVEAERTRNSIEMHDAEIQSLFAISCTLEGCARAAGGADPEQARRLDDCRRLAEKTLAQVRQSIYDLWPAELLERQFLGQLRAHLADMGTPDSPLELEWEARGHLADLSREARHVLLCVAQEALSNVARHAQAHRVGVVLDAGSDPIRLQVADDGCGMALDPIRPQFGIRGMRSRLASLGGQLEVTSEPGRGTTIQAMVPRSMAAADAAAP